VRKKEIILDTNHMEVSETLEHAKKLNFDFTEEEFVKAHRVEYMLRKGSIQYSNNEVIFTTE
jgi:hypothetical protein